MELGEAFLKVPVLSALGERSRGLLIAYAHVRVLAKGEAFFRDGQAATEIAYLVKGRIKLTRTNDDGRESILDLVHEGDALCTSAPTTWQPYCCAAIALEDDTTVLSIPRRDMYRVFEDDPPTARRFVEAMGWRSAGLCDRVYQLSAGQVIQRIASVFVTLAKRAGHDTPEGIEIPILLTRQDVADLSATTVETAIRTIGRLSREGVMRGEKHGFVIQDLAALQAIARGAREIA